MAPSQSRRSIPASHQDADALRTLAIELHEQFLSLGLFTDFGDMCLSISLALVLVFRHLGVAAVVKSCNLVIAHDWGAFLLGFEEPNRKTPPGLIDAHVVCVAEDRLLLDFGLGQARKTWHVPVSDSAVALYTPNSAVMATHHCNNSAYVWLDQPRHNPRVRAVMERNEADALAIFKRWRAASNAPYKALRLQK